MSKVKRYHMDNDGAFEVVDGEWVSYSDHLATIAELTRERDELREELESDRKWETGHPEDETWCIVHCEFGIQVDLWVPLRGWETYGKSIDAWKHLPKAPL